MPGVRKEAVQIRFEILEYLYYNPQPQPRTHIWRKATSLSYDDFQRHLLYLVSRKMVLEDSDGNSMITKQGRDIYEKLRNVLPSIL